MWAKGSLQNSFFRTDKIVGVVWDLLLNKTRRQEHQTLLQVGQTNESAIDVIRTKETPLRRCHKCTVQYQLRSIVRYYLLYVLLL